MSKKTLFGLVAIVAVIFALLFMVQYPNYQRAKEVVARRHAEELQRAEELLRAEELQRAEELLRAKPDASAQLPQRP